MVPNISCFLYRIDGPKKIVYVLDLDQHGCRKNFKKNTKIQRNVNYHCCWFRLALWYCHRWRYDQIDLMIDLIIFKKIFDDNVSMVFGFLTVCEYSQIIWFCKTCAVFMSLNTQHMVYFWDTTMGSWMKCLCEVNHSDYCYCIKLSCCLEYFIVLYTWIVKLLARTQLFIGLFL